MRSPAHWVVPLGNQGLPFSIVLAKRFPTNAFQPFFYQPREHAHGSQRFRNLQKKYPMIPKVKILADLVGTTIEDEKGKWFATAKDLGSLSLALDLATKYPCDPRTLNRAGRDYLERNPEFALGVSVAGLKWIVQGYGYELTGIDVLNTVSQGLKAAEALGRREAVRVEMVEVVRADPRIREIAKGYLAN